jgi:hypothetical protein
MMPLQNETIDIIFEGLDEKSDPKVIKAGKLVRAQNVEFDKTGALNKRRGFLRYSFSGGSQIAALGQQMETQAIRVATYNDELLIFGVGWLWSIASRDSLTGNDDHAVKRGRLSPGNLRVVHVATASEGQE